jgi:hypothetical protein
MDEREKKAAGVSAAVARWAYLIRYILCYLISYRIRYSPSAATLTDMAEQLVLGRKRRRRRRRRKEKEDEAMKETEKEEEELSMDGGCLGRQKKGSRKT